MQCVYTTRRICCLWSTLVKMKARELRRILKSQGCTEVRQKGSHLRIECGSCATTVPVHSGEDLGPGLLRRIERDLEPCLGKGWLKKS
jgi:predicted RNA binding protein YcfA (HicA-like mRNA interferase family)